jgi:X-Pro dipeptidyl-peptidase
MRISRTRRHRIGVVPISTERDHTLRDAGGTTVGVRSGVSGVTLPLRSQ